MELVVTGRSGTCGHGPQWIVLSRPVVECVVKNRSGWRMKMDLGSKLVGLLYNGNLTYGNLGIPKRPERTGKHGRNPAGTRGMGACVLAMGSPLLTNTFILALASSRRTTGSASCSASRRRRSPSSRASSPCCRRWWTTPVSTFLFATSSAWTLGKYRRFAEMPRLLENRKILLAFLMGKGIADSILEE